MPKKGTEIQYPVQ